MPSPRGLLRVAAGALLLASCAPRQRALPPLPESVTLEPNAPLEPGRWSATTSSPHRPQDVAEAELVHRCGVPDAALERVAERLATAGATGHAALDMPLLEFELRVAGAPYVWPHLWTLAGSALPADVTGARFEQWLGSFDDGGQRRCGVTRVQDAGSRELIVAVVTDVLADLEPLPTLSTTGRWLTVTAHLLVPAPQASVLVLGPRGRPQTIPSSLADGTVAARFAPAAPGPWLVQVMATTAGGPRPVARATVFVDRAPPDAYVTLPAPGEAAARPGTAPDSALAAMVNAARASERLPRLARAPDLDAVARGHAEAMRAEQRLAHDLGTGAVRERLGAAGISITTGGENVARAASVERAHRVLWESPSHRETLLYDRYDAFGVGVATESDGTVWVCEVFAQY